MIIFLLELRNNHKTVVIRKTNNDSVTPKNELRINLGANAMNAVANMEIVTIRNYLVNQKGLEGSKIQKNRHELVSETLFFALNC